MGNNESVPPTLHVDTVGGEINAIDISEEHVINKESYETLESISLENNDADINHDSSSNMEDIKYLSANNNNSVDSFIDDMMMISVDDEEDIVVDKQDQYLMMTEECVLHMEYLSNNYSKHDDNTYISDATIDHISECCESIDDSDYGVYDVDDIDAEIESSIADDLDSTFCVSPELAQKRIQTQVTSSLDPDKNITYEKEINSYIQDIIEDILQVVIPDNLALNDISVENLQDNLSSSDTLTDTDALCLTERSRTDSTDSMSDSIADEWYVSF